MVTRQGKDAVVVIAAEEFERLQNQGRSPKGLVQFFAESPLAKANIDLDREPDYGRDVQL